MIEPHLTDEKVTLYNGDCLDVLRELPDASVDAVVTDPPYGLEFMGKDWDGADGFRRSLNAADAGRESVFGRTSRTSPEYRTFGSRGAVVHDPATERGGFQDGNGGNPFSRSRIEYGRGGDSSQLFQEWCEAWSRECLRVLKPGGHMLAFGGSRTWHRLAVAIEDAGFEIRDSIAWLYGSGFPKSMDVSKAIDKGEGHWRGRAGAIESDNGAMAGPNYERTPKGSAVTEEGKRWEGWGTALKPAFEPIVVARKPLSGTVAANVLTHGTGALNIDGCRVGEESLSYGGDEAARDTSQSIGAFSGRREVKTVAGRWPANVVLDEGQAVELDRQSGESQSRIGRPRGAPAGNGWGMTATGAEYDDLGGASRFFYVAKAPSSERVRLDGVAHPTVKPLSLMRWLVRLVTPPGGTVLEPFAGSGTTVEACVLEGFHCIAIEREADYLPLIRRRILRRTDTIAVALEEKEDLGLLADMLGLNEEAADV